MKTINVTAGDCLNQLLDDGKEIYIPFREALIEGEYTAEPFSEDFLRQRADAFHVSVGEYKEKMTPFIRFLEHAKEYQAVVLWFGDEPFCQKNRAFVIEQLQKRDYSGSLTLNIVDETNGKILRQEIIR